MKSRPATLVTLLLVAVLHLSATGAPALSPDDEPAAVQARRALLGGDLPRAIALYEIALAGDPRSRIDWYNYACALARSGRAGDALGALQSALRLGYTDSSWVASDPDLTTLRGDPQFAELMDQMGVRARAAVAAGGLVFHAAQTRLASCEVRLPAGYDSTGGDRWPLVLLLHGRGATATSMQRLAEDLALDGVIYAWADAPYPLDSGEEGHEYWPAWARESGHEADLEHAARLTARWYGEIVRELGGELRMDPERIFVAGFSQGGAMAYLAAMENPGIFAGAAPLAGYVLTPYQTAESFSALAQDGVELFIAHGLQDRVIPPQRAEAAAAMARAAGVSVDLRLYPIGHTVSREVVADLAAWLRARCE